MHGLCVRRRDTLIIRFFQLFGMTLTIVLPAFYTELSV